MGLSRSRFSRVFSAIAPAERETSGQLTAMFPGSRLTEENLVPRPFPISATETGYDAYIRPAVFRRIFCADLPEKTAAAMAASQRPGAVSTLSEHSGPAAWTTIPSWYLVARQDRAIPPGAQRFMANRMKAHAREINSSHVAMISRCGGRDDPRCRPGHPASAPLADQPGSVRGS
jgi:pimeloyl-ACP methyl ester carboxylesterase